MKRKKRDCFQWGDAEGTNKQCQQGMSSPECGSQNTESKSNYHQWQSTGLGGRTEMAISNLEKRQ